MLNSKSFTRYLGVSTFVCTCLLVTMGGCSAAKTSETSSSTVVIETTPSTTRDEASVATGGSGIEEPSLPPRDVAPETALPSDENVADGTLAQAEPKQEIPQPFQGEWNADLEQCGAQVSETRLEISANQLQFHESDGPIQDITSDGDRKLTGTVELSGEGETWQTELELQLSEDQRALTQIMDGTSFVRYRCP